MSALATVGLAVGYDRAVVVPELSVTVPPGKVTVIVGANGCGKSTILKACSRILRPLAGAVELDGDDVHSLPTRALARRLSVLPQASAAPESLTVRELVSYGRYPHSRWLGSGHPDDAAMIDWALAATGTAEFAARPVHSLSGGQQQRAWIAMTLAQGADLLLLDEPTSHLDTCHQLEVMELLARLNRESGKTVVMVLHDLNLAARYAHHMLAIKDGRVAAAGTPQEVMTPATLKEVFGIRARVIPDPDTGTPLCIAYLPDPDAGAQGNG
ncbi:iron-dicitrate transporter atp-binding subunit : ABC transporter related protein OS=Truepera radiovictrix (strain DSM 17093 / CIP 108686 / LMG 22925 / RQ-24) GN=Trad_0345 PE=3 SV=1: ABC_tran [Gemmataceae bacterium]|nr:iron-dicitrate transporter atp-binding subunit : ABC transporter related protein OS=Truepera radiovictrix (strain DSM 17093 / CIP 108686 / LMG 22925 / RQ-24) GN=Trad_0345 PE=3 SV=1: ABC_tran [Gemmataceae bacterium]VTT99604.1 iron-dicitrate transporter atp-binding subunit : ABC transporter related protein OS=Truepera radiovictrix (strain DSM 17093 / CIP 108686 / LMG 22925 / RQ-24) GN=Trad_0345 PE=3 SV=1: ABC_tran [Gemmataceae bacterium]